MLTLIGWEAVSLRASFTTDLVIDYNLPQFFRWRQNFDASKTAVTTGVKSSAELFCWFNQRIALVGLIEYFKGVHEVSAL